MLLLVSVTERLPESLRFLVSFESACEIFWRGNHARLVVALHDYTDGLAAFHSRPFSHSFVDGHEMLAAAHWGNRASVGKAVNRAAHRNTCACAKDFLNVEGNADARRFAILILLK